MMYWKELGHTISFNLAKSPKYNEKYKGFFVECSYIYDKNKEKYRLSMTLRNTGIPDGYKIESRGIDTQYVSGTRETIRDNIARIVEQACCVGFFEPFIDDFIYTYECYSKGYEVLNECAG